MNSFFYQMTASSTLRCIPMAMAFGCGVVVESPSSDVDADPLLVENALTAIDPEPLISWVEETELWLSTDAFCPTHTVETTEDGARRETWDGGCTTGFGTQIAGVLEVYDLDGETWIAGDHFSVDPVDGGEIYFDGVIEMEEQDNLLHIDTAATMCGFAAGDCDEGAITVNLRHTIYPMNGYPDVYAATVSGLMSPGTQQWATSGSETIDPESIMSVEGMWSVDELLCTTEPASGSVVIRSGSRNAIEWNGASECNGCASWVVQGDNSTPYCGPHL